MEFLRSCALQLDEGTPADVVLETMKQRYTTVRCLNVKTCLVRALCTPSNEYTRAVADLLASANDDDARRDLEAALDGKEASAEARAAVRGLPPRLTSNVRALTLDRTAMRTCKRLAAQSAVAKNRHRVRVDGQALLDLAGSIVRAPHSYSLSQLALSLMLLTGRRTCEVLNGRAQFVPAERRAFVFGGQAKQRGKDASYTIPCLDDTDVVLAALAALRSKQNHSQLDNRATSLRYQSLLARTLVMDDGWKQCRKVHALRGIYVRLALALFTFEGDPTDAYITMCILGHKGLTESLVYTTYDVGTDRLRERTNPKTLCL